MLGVCRYISILKSIINPLITCLKNQYSLRTSLINKMLNVQDKYILSGRVYRNRLLHLHLFAMKLYGIVLFDDQSQLWFHNVRGIFFTLTFFIYNITEVSKNLKKTKSLYR